MKTPSKFIITILSLSVLCVGSQASVVASYTFDSSVEGFTGNNTGTLTASGGDIIGTASSNDPQLLLVALGLAPTTGETWTTIEFRVRETQDEVPAGVVGVFNPTGLVVGGGGSAITSAASFSAGPIDVDGYFTVTVDISAWGSNSIGTLRLDPIGGASSNSNSQTSGNTFEVDFIRINDTSPIPEPTTGLLGLLSLALLLPRRRR